jgi:hypothetical protein
MPGRPGDCLLPALLDQPHLVIEVRVVLGVGDQRGGQVYPVTAGEHDPHRRHRPRTPAARGTPTPGAELATGTLATCSELIVSMFLMACQGTSLRR